MNPWLPLLLLLLALVGPLWAAEPPEDAGVLRGQVFLASPTGENVKLGGVVVQLFPEATVQAYSRHMAQEGGRIQAGAAQVRAQMEKLREKAFTEYNTLTQQARQTREAARRKLRQLDAQEEKLNLLSDYASSGLFAFRELPEPIAQVRTDADGRFALPMPKKGRFALAAHAGRQRPAEEYYWLLKVTWAGQAEQQIMVTNDHLASAHNPEESYLADFVPSTREAEISRAYVSQTAGGAMSEICQALHLPNPLIQAGQPDFGSAEAVRLYPELAQAGSPFHTAFLALYEETKRTEPRLLAHPGWPLTLAERVAASLKGPPKP